MKNTFLLKELLLESRLDVVIKKHPEVNKDIILSLSKLDPSGNNKYLDWMVYGYNFEKTGGSDVGGIIRGINSFHKNLNKLNKEFLDDFVKEIKAEWLLTDNTPLAKTFQNIYKTPKDINVYKDYVMALQIFKKLGEKLSKGEVKKLETKVLYEDNSLLITIPKSNRASCFYGSGTKWCTTNKESDYYYNKYTTDGTLIYVINKKEPQTNPWYKSAFFIKKNGEIEVFDAPDNPTDVQTASQKLSSNWDRIKDVIIEYLYQSNLKGVENLYTGQDLITWLESKDLDPLTSLTSGELIKKIGFESLINYLKKRNISIFEYFTFTGLVELYGGKEGKIRKIWDGYKSVGINPLIKMLTDVNNELLLDTISKGGISVDEFLNATLDPDFKSYSNQTYSQDNIFGLLNYFYGSKRSDDWWSSRIGQKLIDIFKDIDLIFGYAESIGVNLFETIDVRGMNILLNKKFDFENALKFTIKNKEHLKSTLTNYGFPKKEVIEYIAKQPNKIDLLKDFIENDLINSVSLKDCISIFDDKKEAFFFWLNGSVITKRKGGKININDVLTSAGEGINKIFPDSDSFKGEMKNVYGENITGEISIKSLWESFFDNDFYQLYQFYLKKGSLNELNTLVLIKAYEDAPVDEETGLKNLVLEKARKELQGSYSDCKLEVKGDVDYVYFEDLKLVLDFFRDGKKYIDFLDEIESNVKDGLNKMDSSGTDFLKVAISVMEDTFGDDFIRTKSVKVKSKYVYGESEKMLYEFKYDYLMDDIIAYANKHIFDEDSLPDSVYDLLLILVDYRYGRFKDAIYLNL